MTTNLFSALCVIFFFFFFFFWGGWGGGESEIGYSITNLLENAFKRLIEGYELLQRGIL